MVDEVRKRPALEILRYDEPDESTDSPLSYNVPRRDGMPIGSCPRQMKCQLFLDEAKPGPLLMDIELRPGKSVLPTLMPPSERGAAAFSPETLEEAGVPSPSALYEDCYEMVKALKEEGALDKYVLNEDDAAAICAVPVLMENGFSFQGMVESCKEEPPSRLMLALLAALRKLPLYREVMYCEWETREGTVQWGAGAIFQVPFCASSKCMSSRRGGTDKSSYKEVFRIEKGWGYDISDFVLEKDVYGRYGIQKNKFIFSDFFLFMITFLFFISPKIQQPCDPRALEGI